MSSSGFKPIIPLYVNGKLFFDEETFINCAENEEEMKSFFRNTKDNIIDCIMEQYKYLYEPFDKKGLKKIKDSIRDRIKIEMLIENDGSIKFNYNINFIILSIYNLFFNDYCESKNSDKNILSSDDLLSNNEFDDSKKLKNVIAKIFRYALDNKIIINNKNSFENLYSFIYHSYFEDSQNKVKLNDKYVLIKQANKDLFQEDQILDLYVNKIIMNNSFLIRQFSNTLEFPKMDMELFKFSIYSLIMENFETFEEINKISIYSIIQYYYSSKFEEYLFDNKSKMDDEKYNKLYSEYQDFLLKLQDYIMKHKEISLEKFDPNYFDSTWSLEEIHEYLDELSQETLENYDDVDVTKIFFPNKKNQNKGEEGLNISDLTRSVGTNTSNGYSYSLSLLGLEKREFYAKNKDKIFAVRLCRNSFNGFIAIIFNNGYVLFEKYDEKSNDMSLNSGAIYMTDVNNYYGLSSKSLKEARDFIHINKLSSSSFYDYRHHRGEWEEYIQTIIDYNTGIDLKNMNIMLDDVKKLNLTIPNKNNNGGKK